jgi:type IV secretion system protein VirB6
MEADIYKFISNIFSIVTSDLIGGFYESAAAIYNNAFFSSIYGAAIVLLGTLLMLNKVNYDEAMQKGLFSIILFGIVKTILIYPSWYTTLLDLIDLPRVFLYSFVSGAFEQIDQNATAQTLVNSLVTSTLDLLNTIRTYGSWKDWFPYVYSTVLLASGSFLIFIIIAMILFSTFLAKVVLSLGIIVLPTLIFTRTQNIFFAWVRLYISLSLYAPATLIFGVLGHRIAQYTMILTATMETNFYDNVSSIIGIVIAQLLVALAIFKIPNIVNQIIGSANEGSSITAGVGTISAVGTIMTAFTKFTGIGIAKKGVSAVAKKSVSSLSDRVKISR